MSSQYQTDSEELFAEYLLLRGITNFKHEPNIGQQGKKNPDFIVIVSEEELVFDVKAFEAPAWVDGQCGWIDPYKHIREKINVAQKQFKQYKDRPCALVLYNDVNPLVSLHEPDVVFGAMFGDFCASWDFDVETGKSDLSTLVNTFHGNGKMIYVNGNVPGVRIGAGKVQNQTFSALITLRYIRIGQWRLNKYYHETQDPTFSAVDFDLDEKHLGVIVWENFLANKPFPKDLFCGEYDLRYTFDQEGRMTRPFVGQGVLEYERIEEELDNQRKSRYK